MPSVGDTIIYNSGHLPAGATTPLTYQWGLSPIGSGTINGSSTGSTVSITWNNTGTHTVNLSMTNCGATVSNSSSVVVSNSCVNVTNVNITGNNTASIPNTQTKIYNVSYDGTAPHTILWSSISPTSVNTTLGSGSSQSITFNECGNWTVQCLVTNCLGASVSASYNVTVSLSGIAAPILSVCGISNQAIFTATGKYTDSTLKLYEVDNSSVHIGLIDTTLGTSFTLDPFVLNARYVVTQEMCGLESGDSNIVITNLNMASC